MQKVKEKSKMDVNERFLRQIDILTPAVCGVEIFIIGAGATGSFTALSLAKMGFSNIRVFDSDTVEEHNFPNQLFPLSAIGKNKAIALKDIVKDFTGADIRAVDKMYQRQPLRGIVISALDSMKGRKLIYKNCCKSKEVKLLIDPRTGAEVVRVLTVDMSLDIERKAYEKTLHSDADAEEVPCTARSIIYSVLTVSAFISKQVKLFQMNQDYKKDLIIDLNHNFLMAS